MWNHLPEILKVESSFKPFKRSPSDWFGPKYKCKISNYLDNES